MDQDLLSLHNESNMNTKLRRSAQRCPLSAGRHARPRPKVNGTAGAAAAVLEAGEGNEQSARGAGWSLDGVSPVVVSRCQRDGGFSVAAVACRTCSAISGRAATSLSWSLAMKVRLAWGV